MPNWTTNHLEITPAGALDHLIFNADGEVDFNVLLPLPPILMRVVSPVRHGDNGRIMLNATADPLSWKMVEATPEEQAEIDAQTHDNWYDWSRAHWGTKWNACHTTPGDLTFDTAWDAPRPWLEALAEHLPPNASLTCHVHHEDGGAEILTFEGA